MSLEILTSLFIGINLFSLWGEIPNIIIFYAISVVGLGFWAKKIPYQAVIKILLLFLSILLIRFSFQKVSSAEGAISFVLVLSSLKFWELKSDNDHFNMFLILGLSEAGIFLLNPSFMLFLMGSFKILFYFYYILKLRQYDLSSLSFKRLLLLILPSITFALILFYTFPRFTQGFLNTSGNLPQSQSGFSDVIDIRSLGPLNLSSKKVFKAYLDESDLKPSINLYWRQSVLWNYYDGSWRTGERNLRLKDDAESKKLKNLFNSKSSLRFVMEGNFSQEFITLDGHQALLDEKELESKPIYYFDQTIRSRTNFKPLTQYHMQYGDGPLNTYTDDFLQKKGSKIKIQETLKSEIQNKFLRDISPSDEGELKLQKLKSNFSKNQFLYSLTPPSYKSTEDFLLNGKAGYCSHFASAFGVLARMAGLPTRLVSGFLGSEYNNFDNSLIVKELDAHVWVEVYLEKSGWVRVDPTELVNPTRLQLSAQDFNNQQSDAFALPQFSAITSVGLWFDAINSRFNESLFGYDQDAQESFLQISFLKTIKVHNLFIGSFIFIISIYFIIFNFVKSSEPKHVLRYRRFLKQMKKYGAEKFPHETASQFMERCLLNSNIPDNIIREESLLYINKQYSSISNLSSEKKKLNFARLFNYN